MVSKYIFFLRGEIPIKYIIFMNLRTKKISVKAIFLNLFFCVSYFVTTAQISNIKYSTSIGTYSSLGSSKVQLIAGGSVFTSTGSASIGFTFNFQGKDYTTFGVGATGSVALGALPSNTSANDIVLSSAAPKLMPYWDYNTVGNLATGGGVFYELGGSSPNRVLTIQFNLVNASSTAATNLSFQVKLYETSNKIEFVYGPGTTTAGASIGLAGLAAAYEYLSISSASHIASRYNYYNDNTAWPGTNRVYSFTPTAVPSGNKLTTLTGAPVLWAKSDASSLANYTYTIVPSPAANRTSSSTWATNWTVATSELASTSTGWISSSADGGNGSNPKGWIQLDLGSVQTIDGIATLGAVGSDYYTRDYTVEVSSDGSTWTNLGLMNGNMDYQTIRYSDFSAPVTCRYVKVYPGGYNVYRAIRLDVYRKTPTNISDGGKVEMWVDQSGNGFHPFQATENNQGIFKINQLNFNPAVISANTANLTTGSWYDIPDLTNIRHAFWVAQDVTPTGGTYNHLLYASSGRGFHGGVNGTLNNFNVGAWRKDAAAATISTSYNFGAINSGKPNLISTSFTTLTSPADVISMGFQTGQTRNWNGPIGEVILFNNALTYNQASEIETYLALKYGISKGDWYIGGLDPTGATASVNLFATTANAPYNQNIFGIGRNDTWGLHQRQSKSANTFDFFWLGNNNIINTTLGNDASSGNDISANGSYFITGDDNGTLGWTRSASPINKRLLGRTWLF